ncbi:PD40 domain-containing protein, partial [Candidatus Venteria ishoeyi]
MSFFKHHIYILLLFLGIILISRLAYATAHFSFATGSLSLPVVELKDDAGNATQRYSVLLQLSADRQGFDYISATPQANAPNATVDAYFIPIVQQAGGQLEIPAVKVFDVSGIETASYRVVLSYDNSQQRFLLDTAEQTENDNQAFQQFYLGQENTLVLQRGGNNQYLLPVEIGDQTVRLLVDTGSNGLLVFEQALSPQLATGNNFANLRRTSQKIKLTGEQATKGFTSTERSGVVAIAPVRIGAFYDEDMRIMLIRQPTAEDDTSLSLKQADGIIGLRRLEGITRKQGDLDVPLDSLQPAIRSFSLDLPPEGLPTLSLGTNPLFANIDQNHIFQAKTYLVNDGLVLDQQIHADLQVPFQIRSPVGMAKGEQLDVLLDTGAVSKLVLDANVAADLGYDPETKTWSQSPDTVVDFSLVGVSDNLAFNPPLTIADISVANYSEQGVSFEAVLGLRHWQQYLVNFHHQRNEHGVADGTISLLHRNQAQAKSPLVNSSPRLKPLSELNSLADDQNPSSDLTGQRIAFQSNRQTGIGGWDIFVWDNSQQSLLTLAGLNSTADDQFPCLSADGQKLVYQSDAEGNADILAYDLGQQKPIELPNLNTLADEQQPCFSPDGQQIVFHSNRDTGQGGQDLYVYDIASAALKTLPGLNGANDETQGYFSADGRYLSFNFVDGKVYRYDLDNLQLLFYAEDGFVNQENATQQAAQLNDRFIVLQSNRRQPTLGSYDRDIFVFDALSQTPLAMPGLNSSVNDLSPGFSRQGQQLVFHSNRPGGLGGQDIYTYDLLLPSTETTTADSLLTEEIDDTYQLQPIDGQGFTIPVTIQDQTLNLLVLTEFKGIALFADKLGDEVDILDLEQPLNWLGMLSGTLATVDIQIQQRLLKDANVLLADSASFQSQLPLLAHIPVAQIDGIFGLRTESFNFSQLELDDTLNKLLPTVKRYELRLSSPFASLSLGKMPLLDRLNNRSLIHHFFTSPTNDLRDLNVNSLITADSGLTAIAPTLFSTLVKDQVIFDRLLAAQLGYDLDSHAWQETETVSMYLKDSNEEQLLPVAEHIAAQQVTVTNLDALSPYTLVLGQDFWQNFTIGQDSSDAGNLTTIGLNNGGYAAPTDAGNDHFIPLPVNTEGDEKAADITPDGQLIVFQSNSLGGQGGWDIYLYHRELGILPLPELNTEADEQAPSLNHDGSLITFHSDRNEQDDVFVFHVPSRQILELANLNTEAAESHASLSADGNYLAFQREREIEVEATAYTEAYTTTHHDIVFYDLQQQVEVEILGLNGATEEQRPSLSQDGNILVFDGQGREDIEGFHSSPYIYDREQQAVRNAPDLFPRFAQETARHSDIDPQGRYLSFSSDRKNTTLKQRGRDVYLFDTQTNQFIFLPGLNSHTEDGQAALSNEAEYIVFQSQRAGGQGGYDLYLYQRNLTMPQFKTVMA